jgi:hypothetical protein
VLCADWRGTHAKATRRGRGGTADYHSTIRATARLIRQFLEKGEGTMRTRMLGSLVAALLALGALAIGATGASAVTTAKPKLWLTNAGDHARVPTGTPVQISVTTETCAGSQAGSVSSNGKPVDLLKPSGSMTVQCYESQKLAGTIKSVAVAPAEEQNMTMTLNSVLHLQVEPWCTYALPHKIVFGSTFFTESAAEATAVLDKAASFAPSCTPTRTLYVRMIVENGPENFPFEGEVIR